MPSAGEWLVPFRGRNTPCPFDQNFLWRYKSIYVMDNHRAAMWCWLQHVNPRSPHSLLHIDRHYDALKSELDEANWPPDLEHLDINEYLNLDYPVEDLGLGSDRIPLFRWDNYLSLYLARYHSSINRAWMLTHGDGDAPKKGGGDAPEEYEQVFTAGHLWDIPENIDNWLYSQCGPWILNIDLDYFFWHENEKQPGIIVSEDYLKACFEKIRKKIEDETVVVTTIALTPNRIFTGGWEPAESLAQFILRALNVDFELPQVEEGASCH